MKGRTSKNTPTSVAQSVSTVLKPFRQAVFQKRSDVANGAQSSKLFKMQKQAWWVGMVGYMWNVARLRHPNENVLNRG